MATLVCRGSRRERPARPPHLLCGTCRRRARLAGRNNARPKTKGDGRHNTIAMRWALLTFLAIPSGPPAAMALHRSASFVDSPVDSYENKNKVVALANWGNYFEPKRVSFFYNNSKKEGNDQQEISHQKEGCPRDGMPWQRVVAATLLLNAASTLLGIVISRLETNQEQCCLGGSAKSRSCHGAKNGLAVFSALMLIMAALRTYANALELIPTSQYDAGLVLSFCGFVLPIVVSTSYCCLAFFRKDGDTRADVSEADLSTVNNEEDCQSCETCGLEHQNSHLPEEHFPFAPPSQIVLQDVGKRNESMKDPGRSESAGRPKGTAKNRAIWLAHLLLHGLFVGAASLSSCHDGALLPLVGAIALCHPMVLERRAVANIAPARGALSRSLLTLGGLVVVAAAAGGAASCYSVAGAILAMAGGAYANTACVVVIVRFKQYWIGQSRDSGAPKNSSHLFRHEETTLGNVILNRRCAPCEEAPSTVWPIPMQRPSQSNIAEKIRLTKEYDRVTWQMYARITSAREARAKCGFCMGSMDEDEAAAIVTKGAPSEEERRLIRTCPSPLHLGSDNHREAALATKKNGLMVVHQECYYGAMGGQHECPHKKNMILAGENMLFQLEL